MHPALGTGCRTSIGMARGAHHLSLPVHAYGIAAHCTHLAHGLSSVWRVTLPTVHLQMLTSSERNCSGLKVKGSTMLRCDIVSSGDHASSNC